MRAQVLDNHRLAGAQSRPGGIGGKEGTEESRAEVDFLKRYIHYCRSQCAPRLSEGAQERLAAYYVEIRDEVGAPRVLRVLRAARRACCALCAARAARAPCWGGLALGGVDA